MKKPSRIENDQIPRIDRRAETQVKTREMNWSELRTRIVYFLLMNKKNEELKVVALGRLAETQQIRHRNKMDEIF